MVPGCGEMFELCWRVIDCDSVKLIYPGNLTLEWIAICGFC